MSETKKGLCITIVSFVLFIILVILLKTVDVKEVGLSGLNNLYLHEYNKALDIVSDVLLYLSFLAFLAVAVYFLYKLIKTKTVDYRFLVYFLVMVVVVILYLVFDHLIKINGRPYEPEEASFPSTHVLLATYILLPITTFFFRKNREEVDQKIDKETVISLIAFIIIGVMVVLRFWSGDHWLTDSIGGLILGVFAFGLFYFLSSLIKDKKSLE